jgi:hypothetical protein
MRTLFTALLAALFLAACDGGEPPSSMLSEDEALQVAQGLLTGLNEADYDRFSADFSDALAAGIPEDGFLEFQATVQQTSGQWLSIEGISMEDASSRGYVTWVVDTDFEKEPVVLELTFPEKGTELEGVMFYSDALDELY